MAERTITSANSILMLAQPILFPVPQQMQGFGTDDVYSFDAIKIAEVLMGVDGKLSAGYVFVEVPQNITLQADSASNDFFDIIYAQSVAARETYRLSGLVSLPSIGTKLSLVRGVMMNYKPAPDAKRVLQARTFQVVWESIAPAPI